MSSASAFDSSPCLTSPGIPAPRALLGLFLCLALSVLTGPTRAASGAALPAAARTEAAVLAQPPDGGTPSGDEGGNDGEEDEGEEDELFPDTTRVIPQTSGPKAAGSDTTRAAPSASSIPQTVLPGPGAPGTGPGVAGTEPGRPARSVPPPPPAKPPARRGVFGLHPAVVVLGLVVAHVLVIKLVTD